MNLAVRFTLMSESIPNSEGFHIMTATKCSNLRMNVVAMLKTKTNTIHLISFCGNRRCLMNRLGIRCGAKGGRVGTSNVLLWRYANWEQPLIFTVADLI